MPAEPEVRLVTSEVTGLAEDTAREIAGPLAEVTEDRALDDPGAGVRDGELPEPLAAPEMADKVG
jgi:hypothetical protein